MSTVTRFAVTLKHNGQYYCDKKVTGDLFSKDIWKATLYKKKPAIVEHQEVVMVTITYEEQPYVVV